MSVFRDLDYTDEDVNMATYDPCAYAYVPEDPVATLNVCNINTTVTTGAVPFLNGSSQYTTRSVTGSARKSVQQQEKEEEQERKRLAKEEEKRKQEIEQQEFQDYKQQKLLEEHCLRERQPYTTSSPPPPPQKRLRSLSEELVAYQDDVLPDTLYSRPSSPTPESVADYQPTPAWTTQKVRKIAVQESRQFETLDEATVEETREKSPNPHDDLGFGPLGRFPSGLPDWVFRNR